VRLRQVWARPGDAAAAQGWPLAKRTGAAGPLLERSRDAWGAGPGAEGVEGPGRAQLARRGGGAARQARGGAARQDRCCAARQARGGEEG
jgi:hypothetical protein